LALFAAYAACVSLTVIDALGTAVWVFPFLLLVGIVASIEIDQGQARRRAVPVDGWQL
jgi:hypothetical protein